MTENTSDNSHATSDSNQTRSDSGGAKEPTSRDQNVGGKGQEAERQTRGDREARGAASPDKGGSKDPRPNGRDSQVGQQRTTHEEQSTKADKGPAAKEPSGAGGDKGTSARETLDNATKSVAGGNSPLRPDVGQVKEAGKAVEAGAKAAGSAAEKAAPKIADAVAKTATGTPMPKYEGDSVAIKAASGALRANQALGEHARDLVAGVGIKAAIGPMGGVVEAGKNLANAGEKYQAAKEADKNLTTGEKAVKSAEATGRQLPLVGEAMGVADEVSKTEQAYKAGDIEGMVNHGLQAGGKFLLGVGAIVGMEAISKGPTGAPKGSAAATDGAARTSESAAPKTEGATPKSEGSAEKAGVDPNAKTVEAKAVDPNAKTVEAKAVDPNAKTVEAKAVDPNAKTVEAKAGVDPNAKTVAAGAPTVDAPSAGAGAKADAPKVDAPQSKLMSSDAWDAAFGESHELRESGKAYNPDGSATPEYKAVSDKLRDHLMEKTDAKLQENRAQGTTAKPDANAGGGPERTASDTGAKSGEGKAGPNGTDRPTLGEHKMAPKEHADAQARKNDLVNSGKAWDAKGQPTTEFKSLEQKLDAHHDVTVEARIGELQDAGMRNDNASPEYDQLMQQRTAHVMEKADVAQRQHDARQRAKD